MLHACANLTKDLCHRRLKHSMFFFFPTALVVSRRPLTAEAKVRYHASPREIYGGEIGNETGFFRVLRFSSVGIIPPMLHNHCCSDKMNQWAKPGNIPITHTFGNRGALYRKVFLLLSLKYH